MGDEREDFKKWLRELREAREWTQEDVAEMLGLDRRTIINLEGAGGLKQAWPLIQYLRFLEVLSDEAPVETPAATRLAALEAGCGELIDLVTEALELLREAQQPGDEEARAGNQGG